MTHSKIILLFLVYIFFIIADAVTFEIENQCPYTVWAAAIPGGGQQLNPTQSWSFNVSSGLGRVWGRTGCIFDASGRGRCLTGDCGGLLQCKGSGTPPNTLIEYTFDLISNQDIFDISLVDGFNLPLDFIPVSSATLTCRGSLRCVGDIKRQCPNELRVPGGCNNACGVFRSGTYCCTGESSNCGPTIYSRFFKQRCPAAFSYPLDDHSSFSCPAGANYKVVFCPCVENICTVPSVSWLLLLLLPLWAWKSGPNGNSIKNLKQIWGKFLFLFLYL